MPMHLVLVKVIFTEKIKRKMVDISYFTLFPFIKRILKSHLVILFKIYKKFNLQYRTIVVNIINSGNNLHI